MSSSDSSLPPDFFEDRGARLGIPASLGSTELMMAIFESIAFKYAPLSWMPYFYDLMSKLTKESGYDPLRLFSREEMRHIGDQLPSQWEVGGVDNFWRDGLAKKSVAALAIEDGKAFHNVEITDWGGNPIVAMHRQNGLLPREPDVGKVRALEHAANRDSVRIRMLETMFEKIRERGGTQALSRAALLAASTILTPQLLPQESKVAIRHLLPNSCLTANFLMLVGAGAQVDLKEWEEFSALGSSGRMLSDLVALERNQIPDNRKARILSNLHQLGHPLESQGDGIKQPLHRFVTAYDFESIQVLLSAGVDVEKKDDCGRTAREIAVDSSFHNIVAMFDAANARHVIESSASETLTPRPL